MNTSKPTNYFYSFHPAALLFYYILVIFAIFKCDYNYNLIYAFISLSICSVYLKGIMAYIKSLLYYMVLILATGIFNVVFNHSGENVFLYVNNIPLTFDSLFYGFYTGVLVSCLLLWFTTLNESMDTGKINYLIGTRLKATGMILSLTFGFTEKFRYKLDIIRHTLYTQGIRTLNLKYGATVLSLLINVMLEDSSITADSMIARGYTSKGRKSYKKYDFYIKDVCLLILASICFTLFLLFDGFIILLILIPVIHNIYKEFLWKYYLSKI